ncbi:MAG: single-stranded DNA-binding protein [Verrucomicrobiota bacterium]|nr:single-stranded DNA-binding protein [Verrucomicrobiota bacterium]
MTTKIAQQMIRAARQLCKEVDALQFPPPVAWVYNPLDYGLQAHEDYLQRYAANRKRFIFLGMNPGPFGMVQTAIPFGEIHFVRDWLGIREISAGPAETHPKRPVQGFQCQRSEVSGKRLWGLFEERFCKPSSFFQDHFVANYCPLAFLEETGRNLTPDKIPSQWRQPLFDACNRHLQEILQILKPEIVIGIGRFASQRAEGVATPLGIKTTEILHPSPASPAANKDWKGKVSQKLMEAGIWTRNVPHDA